MILTMKHRVKFPASIAALNDLLKKIEFSSMFLFKKQYEILYKIEQVSDIIKSSFILLSSIYKGAIYNFNDPLKVEYERDLKLLNQKKLFFRINKKATMVPTINSYLIAYCKKHKNFFVTKWRYLSLCEPLVLTGLCLYCKNLLVEKFGKEYTPTILNVIKITNNFRNCDFNFDFNKLESMGFSKNTFITDKISLPIIWKSCGTKQKYPWLRLKQYLRWQGKYPTPNKMNYSFKPIGCTCEKCKSNVKDNSLDFSVARRRAKRLGYKIQIKNDYKSQSQKIWFVHDCGAPVYVAGRQLTVCRLCNRIKGTHRTFLKLIDSNDKVKSIWAGNIWIGKLSDGTKSLIDYSFAHRCGENTITIKCHLHNFNYTVFEKNFLKSKSFGCEKCLKDFQKARTVFKIEDLIQLAKNRDVKLLTTAKNYTDIIKMKLPNGTIKIQPILAMLREYPLFKDGYHKQAKNSDKRKNIDLKGRRYQLDDRAFSELSCQSAYWGGWIAADGSIVPNRNTFILLIKVTDEEILKHLMIFLDTNKHLNYRYSKASKERFENSGIYAELRITSRQILTDLSRLYNLKHIPGKKDGHKTHALSPPVSLESDDNKKFFWAYLAGFFEGDGNISQYGAVRISCASKSMIDWLQQTLHKKCRYQPTVYELPGRKSKNFELSLNSEATKTFVRQCKKYAPCLLKRKWKKVE